MGKGRVVFLVLSEGKSHRNQHPHICSIFTLPKVFHPHVLWKYLKISRSIVSLGFLKLTQPASKILNTADKESLQKRDFPGSPVVKTPRFHYWGLCSIPGQGTKILQAEQLKNKKARLKIQGKYVKLRICTYV